MTSKGLLVVCSGPSGAGKGTVLKAYLDRHPQARFSISATTRAPRPGEQDGREYYFVSREEFARMQRDGELLESAEYCGNCYGTPRAPLEAWMQEGCDVLLDIEVQGGAQVRRAAPDSVGVFILPPSLQELEARLRGRGTEEEAVIAKRMATARRELTCVRDYDYALVNSTVDAAVQQLESIILAEKCKMCRDLALVERMLAQ